MTTIEEENENIIDNGALNSVLVKYFCILPEDVKIVTAQQCMAAGLESILRARGLELQTELLNINEQDAAELVKKYTLLRLELTMLDDLRAFIKYAGAYYVNAAAKQE